jgi:uncharacterized Fe-S cluster-containing MiaB family protein
MQPLLVIVYVSSATQELDADALNALARKARSHNLAHGITGVLLYQAGSFMQAIEGPRDEVAALFERICRDRRHRHVIVLHQQTPADREFPGGRWPGGPTQSG